MKRKEIIIWSIVILLFGGIFIYDTYQKQFVKKKEVVTIIDENNGEIFLPKEENSIETSITVKNNKKQEAFLALLVKNIENEEEEKVLISIYKENKKIFSDYFPIHDIYVTDFDTISKDTEVTYQIIVSSDMERINDVKANVLIEEES